MTERTLSIIKPDGVRRNITGKINSIIEEKGFRIVGQKRIQMHQKDAEYFYQEHQAKPFFKDLVAFMISGPVIVQVLQKENAISDYRALMGATNPKEANADTIRGRYGISLDENTVHGSDSEHSAKREINCFFAVTEIIE